ncbi:MAG: 8-oxo-dGTP diphosphatase [Candidatus Absconditabacteria bacterium]
MIQSTLVILLNSKGQILLNMKKRGFGVGKYNGAGGKIMPGESVIQGAVRELEEETAINLSESDLINRGVFHFYFENKPSRNQDVHLFSGLYDGNFQETEEMKPEWFDIDKIPYDLMWEDDSYWLPRILAGDEKIEYTFNFNEDGKISSFEKIQ